jgi:hypothetical protein
MHLSEWVRCQKAISGIYFTKKWRAETVQPSLEFDNFKSRLKTDIFKCISWLNGLLLLGVMIRVFWKRESIPIYWHHCRLLTRQICFGLHIYSRCTKQPTGYTSCGVLQGTNKRGEISAIALLLDWTTPGVEVTSITATQGEAQRHPSRIV